MNAQRQKLYLRAAFFWAFLKGVKETQFVYRDSEGKGLYLREEYVVEWEKVRIIKADVTAAAAMVHSFLDQLRH